MCYSMSTEGQSEASTMVSLPLLLLIAVFFWQGPTLCEGFQAIRGAAASLLSFDSASSTAAATAYYTGGPKLSNLDGCRQSQHFERISFSLSAEPRRSSPDEIHIHTFTNATRVSSFATTSASSSSADDERRRQLLFSMLAAAAGSSAMRAPPAQAVTTAEDLKTIQQQSLSTPDFFDVIKPPLDDSEYVAYTLDNGLRVLLCSDPYQSNDAAAAMDVHVGACSDPDAVPGLAHFNEHMLFLGTKKYPREDSFEAFLATNGGASNAYTDSENTVYYFSIGAEADNKLAEGLSRFGSFFTEPLFTESATSRELNAIESENAKNLQSDIFRIFQINKSRANPNHPFSKFFTGNKETLLDGTKRQGIDLRSELINFYNSYYSANQMSLAVVAPQPIDTLKQMVEDAFGDIPNRNVSPPEQAWMGVPPFGGENSIIPSFQHVVEVVPVSDLRQVQVTWPVVYRSEFDRRAALLIKPSLYVAHLLGHEGPLSLLSYLKRKGWANSLGCAGSEDLSDFEAFEITVGLTSRGLVAINSVIEAIYSYVQLMRERTIPDFVFKEVLQLEELQWRFLTKGAPAGYAQSISTAMQKYPPALYVAGPRRLALDEFAADPQLSGMPRSSFPSKQQLDRTREQVQTFTDAMSVDNAMVSVLSKSFDGQTDQKERWYGTNFSVRPIPADILDQWRNCNSARKLKLGFPKPNQFIPTEAGLRVKFEPDGSLKKKKTFEERMVPITPPRIIRDDGPTGRWTVYFNEDRRFGKPKGFLVFQLLTSTVFSSPMNAALANLYELSVSDRLGEYAYDAELAGLSYDLKVLPRGVRFTFGGYNDKLKRFAAFVSKKLAETKDLIPKDDNEFDRYKDQIMRALSAFDVKQPYAHASYYAQLTLQPRRFQYTNQELRDATRKTTLPDLVSYANSLWTSGKGEALIQGNFNELEALDLVKSIGDVLPFKPIPENEYPRRLEALPLPTSPALVLPPRLLVAEPNPANENSVSYVMLQSLDKSDKDHVLLEIVNAIVEEPFYNELRTKKQLGYIVASGVKAVAETRTISFIVQSSVAPSDALTIEILNFLDKVESTILEKLSKIDLAVYVKSLIDKKTEPDKDLAIEVQRNWAEIATGRLQFDRRQREAAALLDIEKEDLLDFWKRIYSGSGRRVLITEMIPRQGAASSKPPPLLTGYGDVDFPTESYVFGIDDIEEFRRVREKLVYEQGMDFPDYTKATFQTAAEDRPALANAAALQ